LVITPPPAPAHALCQRLIAGPPDFIRRRFSWNSACDERARVTNDNNESLRRGDNDASEPPSAEARA
jgi:hypothetical protein